MKKNYYSQYNPSEVDLLTAYNLMFGKEGQISYSELPWGDSEQFILPSDSNQEKSFLRREAFEKLSDEAKEVIDVLLNSSGEILQIICTSKFGMYSKRLLKKYFHENKGWKNKKIEKTFREITHYVNAL